MIMSWKLVLTVLHEASYMCLERNDSSIDLCNRNSWNWKWL